MCGVAGIYLAGAGRRDGLGDAVERMIFTLQHRGPDGQGVWADQDAGYVVGHRRLSILDLSAAGHQPMASACGRFVIAFNGEIYNHLALREELQGAAANQLVWRGHSDTETLLAGFASWGVEEALRRVTGMFALALWDRKERVLTLARDRMGEKPLYYGWQGDVFLFGSELKALKAYPGFNAAIDRNALSLFLRHNYIPAPYSIYEGVFKLPAGCYLQLQDAQRQAEPVPYWSLAEVAENGVANPFEGSEGEAIDELERRLGAAVQGQMLADVPIGTLLSGGLDSTLIAALLQMASAQPVRTFTVGFDECDYDESAQARAVARHLGTAHTELRLKSTDALSLVPSLPSIYDEPFADSSQLPTYLVMQLAREHVTVALSGDAGDESFGGYNRYVHVPQVWKQLGWMPGRMRKMLGGLLTAMPSEQMNRLLGPLGRRAGVAQAGDKAHKLGRRLAGVHSIDDLYLSLVSEWSPEMGVVIGGAATHELLDNRDSWPRLDDPVARMMALDGLTYLPDDILTKVDRAAMAVSLETRAPFLDRSVIEFAWSLPMHMKIRNGQGKWILRRLLDRHVPRELVERPKMGFGIPLDAWLRGPLREWAEDLLGEDRLRREGFFKPEPIRTAWQAHVNGRASSGYRLWSVLMFQAWLEAQA